MLYQLYLHISKTRNLLLFVITITNTQYFNKLVSDLDIEISSPDSWDYKDSKFCYPPAGHIATGNLKIITDSRIRSIISKGPKYRFPAHIDFNKCWETICPLYLISSYAPLKKMHSGQVNKVDGLKLSPFQKPKKT